MEKRIFMIIDDDKDDIDFLCEALAELFPTAKYVCAKNGEEALSKLEGPWIKRPDLIFLDLNMPRMDGKTCLGHLKLGYQFKGDSRSHLHYFLQSQTHRRNKKDGSFLFSYKTE